MAFWNKKVNEFEAMADVIEQNGNKLSIERLAEQLHVSRTTIDRRLPSANEAGILLAEDDDGNLSVIQRGKK